MSRPTKLENATIEYFPGRGRAEPIRLMLEDHGIPYANDTSCDSEDWNEIKMVYEKYPFNQVPVFRVNGQTLSHQDAILRYISKVIGTTEQSFQDETISDMLAISIEDLHRMYTVAHYSSDHIQDFTKLLTTTVPKVFAQYERLLSRLPSANPPIFIEGPHPSFAEYTLFHMVEAITTLQPSALGKTGRLQAWFEAFGERKGIKAYVNSDRRHEQFLGNSNGQFKILD